MAPQRRSVRQRTVPTDLRGLATRGRTMRVNSLIGGRRDVDSVVPGQCPSACSHPDVRHR
jgi:hypothetical protein